MLTRKPVLRWFSGETDLWPEPELEKFGLWTGDAGSGDGANFNEELLGKNIFVIRKLVKELITQAVGR